MAAKLIGLVGHSGSGKTTIANHLSDRYGGYRTSLSEPIKAMAGALLDRLAHDSYTDKDTTLDLFPDVTPKKLYDSLAVDWIEKALGYGAIARIWKNKYWAVVQGAEVPLITIDDVTRRTDAQAVLDMGGSLVRVFRPDTDFEVDHHDQHSIEAEISTIETTTSLWNDGGAGDLMDRVDLMAGAFGLERVTERADYPHQSMPGFVYTSPNQMAGTAGQVYVTSGSGGGGSVLGSAGSMVAQAQQHHLAQQMYNQSIAAGQQATQPNGLSALAVALGLRKP